MLLLNEVEEPAQARVRAGSALSLRAQALRGRLRRYRGRGRGCIVARQRGCTRITRQGTADRHIAKSVEGRWLYMYVTMRLCHRLHQR